MFLKLKKNIIDMLLGLDHAVSRDVLCTFPSLTDIHISLDKATAE